MGGIQAVLILGPILTGLAFDYVGILAPYLLGGLLAALALLVAAKSLSGSRQGGSKGSGM